MLPYYRALPAANIERPEGPNNVLLKSLILDHANTIVVGNPIEYNKRLFSVLKSGQSASNTGRKSDCRHDGGRHSKRLSRRLRPFKCMSALC